MVVFGVVGLLIMFMVTGINLLFHTREFTSHDRVAWWRMLDLRGHYVHPVLLPLAAIPALLILFALTSRRVVGAVVYGVLIIAVVVLTTSCSLTDEQRDKIIDVVQRIPTPTATPAPTPTPTPIPAPTPKPDVSVGASMRGVAEFAEGEGIPTMDTHGRGIFLDFRGRSDFDEKFALWCREAKGAAMPAATDAEPRGIYHQCE